ncbi:MAG: hypothetical protein R3B13_30295 [Polyangiaceae bacterium]
MTRRSLGLLIAAGLLATTAPAGATDVLDFSELGTQNMGRSGAWVARATTPLATFYNPAGLAGQRLGASADVALSIDKFCFTRAGPGSTLQGGVSYGGEVCSESGVEPLPAIAGVLALGERLGIGLSVAPPSLYGSIIFPETVSRRNIAGVEADFPAPQRYLLLESNGLFLNTTLSAGYAVTDEVRVGAGFIWGLANYKLANANQSVPVNPQPDGSYEDPIDSDIQASIDVTDLFIPGFVVGVLASPLAELDVGFSLTVQEAFDGHGDLETKANYWTGNGVSDNPTVGSSTAAGEDLAHFRLPNPLDIRLGARFHLPRDSAPALLERDPLEDDVFDIELDLSYTRNSAYQEALLRFPTDKLIEVKGTGGRAPFNADVPFKLKGDTLGLRLGGDYNVLPGRLAVRCAPVVGTSPTSSGPSTSTWHCWRVSASGCREVRRCAWARSTWKPP